MSVRLSTEQGPAITTKPGPPTSTAPTRTRVPSGLSARQTRPSG